MNWYIYLYSLLRTTSNLPETMLFQVRLVNQLLYEKIVGWIKSWYLKKKIKKEKKETPFHEQEEKYIRLQ